MTNYTKYNTEVVKIIRVTRVVYDNQKKIPLFLLPSHLGALLVGHQSSLFYIVYYVLFYSVFLWYY